MPSPSAFKKDYVPLIKIYHYNFSLHIHRISSRTDCPLRCYPSLTCWIRLH